MTNARAGPADGCVGRVFYVVEDVGGGVNGCMWVGLRACVRAEYMICEYVIELVNGMSVSNRILKNECVSRIDKVLPCV